MGVVRRAQTTAQNYMMENKNKNPILMLKRKQKNGYLFDGVTILTGFLRGCVTILLFTAAVYLQPCPLRPGLLY